jgi:hypothetical protein
MPTLSTLPRRTTALTRLGVLLAAALLALSLAGAILPQAARASTAQYSIMMDDDLLLYRGPAIQEQTLRRMKALGVDYVRVTVLWSLAAENVRSTKPRRRRFNAARPSTYPHRNWDRYDNLVRAAKRVGVGVYFNLTGPGPDFAHAKPPRSQRRNRRTWRPKPREFYKFVAAVGTRYSGSYADENEGRSALPRVNFWSLWNEPNQGGWLTPQWSFSRKLRRLIPASPAIYRKLYFFGRRALDRTGHGSDVILVGETAPLGSRKMGARMPIRPKRFMREMFCVKKSGAPLRGRSARARSCGDFTKYHAIRAYAWAHHPYTKNLPPTQRDASPDSVTMANIGELPSFLDTIADRTHRVAGGLGVVSSEFGYETNPPDPFSGIAPVKQAEFLNDGDFLAYRDPRVYGQTQFLLRDVDPVTRHRPNTKAYWFTYQSGLFNINDTPKPSATAYMLPFIAFPIGLDPDTGTARISIGGQLRFRPNDDVDKVQIEFAPAGASEWQPVGDAVDVPVDTHRGFFSTVVTSPGPGYWRAHWFGPGGSAGIASRVIPLG